MHKSCGVTHENNVYIYGGNPSKQQILQLVNCDLTSIGTIPFNHETGACDSTNGIIVLCFDRNDDKQCRQATSPLGPWSNMTPSIFSHLNTQIAMSPGD